MRASVLALGELLSESPPFEQLPGEYGSCIQTSKLTVAALAKLDVKAKACATGAVVANAAAVPLIDGAVPVDDWPVDAWAVGVQLGDEQLLVGQRSTVEPYRRVGWVGHVVVVGDDFVLDPTFGQFARPDRGLHVPAVLLVQRTFGELLVRCTFDDDGSRVDYFLEPRVAAFRTSNAWQAAVDGHAAEYAKAVKATLFERSLRR